MKISQCMITKNEEKNIRRALSWGRGIVDEQIVVDTGSTDQTVAIAEEMGAKVFHFKWVDDFAVAKNYAISKCSGDWICFLDADEYFNEEDANRLREILPMIDNKTTMVFGKPRKIDAIMTPLVNLTAKNEVLNRVSQIRIFRRSKNIRYSGKIHEKLVAQQSHDLVGEKIDNALTVLHTGYAWIPESEKKKEKGERNLAPVLAYLKENPKDPKYHLYASDAYGMLDQYDEAYSHAMLVIKYADDNENRDVIISAYQEALFSMVRMIELGRGVSLDKVLSVYHKACNVSPRHPDFKAALGLCYSTLRMYKDAILVLESLPFVHDHSYTAPPGSKIVPYMPFIYRALSEACLREQKLTDAVRYAMKLLEMDFYRVGSIVLLVLILVEGKTLSKDILSLLTRLYSLANKRDVAFLIEAFRVLGSSELAHLLLDQVQGQG